MELSELNKVEIWNRQNGMCGMCGKKIEELNQSVEYDFYVLDAKQTETDTSKDFAMLCSICRGSAVGFGSNGDVKSLKRYNFPYGNFTSYDYNSQLTDIAGDIEELSKLAETTPDFKEIRNKFKDVMQTVRNLSLENEHKEDLLTSLNNSIESLNKRQNEAQKIQDESYTELYTEFKNKVETASAQVSESSDYRAIRETLTSLQNEFKDLKLKQEHRDLLQDKIGSAFDELNRRQSEERESYEMECIENYHNIKAIVDEAVNFASQSENFRQARTKLVSAQNEFKGLKLKKEQREEQYARIQAAFEVLNQRQRSEWEGYLNECDENYEKLKNIIDAALDFSSKTEDFKEARESLITAQNEFKGLKLKKEQREEQYARIQAAFEVLNQRQRDDWEKFESECNENFIKLSEQVDESIQNANTLPDFRTIRESLINTQNLVKDAKLKKEHRNQLFKRIRQGFDILDNRRVEYRSARKSEKREKLEAILANLEGKLARLEESIQRDTEALGIQSGRLADVKPGEKEQEQKDEIMEKIENIESRIKEKDISKSEILTRIEDIQKELSVI